MSEDIIIDAARRVTESIQKQLEYELRAAWRLGYDYVHVYGDAPGGGSFGPREKIAVRQYTLTSNQKQPPRPDTRQYRYTYDLTDVSDEEIRAAIRGDA